MRALSDEVTIDRTDTGTRVRIRRTITEGATAVTDATMTVDHDSADTVRIALAGEIDMANADEVEQQILGAITNQLTARHARPQRARVHRQRRPAGAVHPRQPARHLQIALRLVVPERSPIRRVIDLSGMATAIPVRSS